eukprot:13166632-Alexandrium_andersonii.AAC.1
MYLLGAVEPDGRHAPVSSALSGVIFPMVSASPVLGARWKRRFFQKYPNGGVVQMLARVFASAD